MKKRIKKVTQTTPLQAEVVDDVFGNSTKNTVSQKSINDVLTYSAEEQRVGNVKKDGKQKPKYSITYTILNNDGTYDLDISLLKVENLIDMSGYDNYARGDVEYDMPLHYFTTTEDRFTAFRRNNVIRIFKGTAQIDSGVTSFYKTELTLVYTKTTDEWK